MRFWVWGILVLILIAPALAAEEGNIKILAVTSDDGKVKGSVADLSLEIIPGKGRVFLETFPVTKVDTQISMRFAQQFACDFLDKDCNDLDFIYTIRAGSSIIGGPSAGASATVLTIGLLGDIDLDKKVAMTGTINPGGLIGGVGGIKQKIAAAKEENFTTVLIPAGKRVLTENNQTEDMVSYGEEIDIKVIEVGTIEDVLTIYTPKEFVRETAEVKIDEQYEEIMREVANKLCERNARLREEFASRAKDVNLSEAQTELMVATEDNINKARSFIAQQQYYAAASFCFRSNINVAYVNTMLANYSQEETAQTLVDIKKGIAQMGDDISNKSIRSITDLQSYLIVKERLIEANDRTDQAIIGQLDPTYALALANERLYSAVAWSTFFKADSPRYRIDKESLLSSCEQKIREAEERYQYVSLYLPEEPQRIRRDIDRAYESGKNGNTDQCLFKASQAKAEADMIISVIAASDEQVKPILDQKLELARQAIIASQNKGLFPIIGYSYYEYAKSLVEEDQVSALRFTQYAIEMSSLDLYFKKNGSVKVKMDTERLKTLALGVLLGACMLEAVYWWRKKRKDEDV